MPLNPLFASALLGLTKGILNRHFTPAPEEAERLQDFVEGTLVAPIREELEFRLAPFQVADKLGWTLPRGATAIPFGLCHVDPVLTFRQNLVRVLDATVGGLLYESAYRQGGIASAAGAHILHNLVLGLTAR